MIVTVLILIAGFVLLIFGAEALVGGASKLAAALGISPLVIGLTVVAFGTSSPELAVNIKAAMVGQESIGLGNVIGSNICNVLLILGLSALIAPLTVSQQLVKLDVPVMIGVSILTLLMSLDGTLSRTDGLILFTGLLIYIAFLIYQSKKESADIQAEYAQEYACKKESTTKDYVKNTGLVIIGFLMLAFGSRLLVDSAVIIAQYFGVSELIIGLTIVALGTSLPEVVTSVIASLRGERDIAVGNVVGSNIFNIMAVLGLTSIIAPNGLPISDAVISFDLPIMIAVAVACLPIFFIGFKISRWEGGLFVAYYVAYLLYLILGATQHSSLPMFEFGMAYFVLPLTFITLFVLGSSALRRSYVKPKNGS